MRLARFRGMLAILTMFPALCIVMRSYASDVAITIDASKTGPRLSPLQHGIFYEEINHAGDGGLNAELIRNSNFADGQHGWMTEHRGNPAAVLQLRDTQHVPGMPRELILYISAVGPGEAGLRNDGYFGIGVEQGREYELTIEARAEEFENGPIRAAVVSHDGLELASHTLPIIGREWKRYTAILKPRESNSKAHLVILGSPPKTIYFREISLVQRIGGKQAIFRSDLDGLVGEMKPSFVRFPGGCFVEGDKLANRFVWKTSLGPAAGRAAHQNLWGYTCSNGLGYHEFLLWCEKMRSEPLFVVNVGMSHTDIVPMDKMGEYVQDALDAIEYANGPVTSTWGAKRTAAGHPKPFGLKYMEIGNENGGHAYEERYALFWDAIKRQYPGMTLIANVPVSSRPMDIVDEHYYSNARFFVRQSTRYDSYSRTGPKIYVGEYAVTEGCGRGNLIAGLGEAFFITGMERNADVVHMASYAPLFVNMNDRKWNPDAIVFDSLRSYGTPSYWVQQMFSVNRGDVVLKSEVKESGDQKPKGPDRGAVGVGTWITSAEFKDLKVVRDGNTIWSGDTNANPLTAKSGRWTIANGTAAQSSQQQDCRAIGGDPAWSDYIFSLKARKLSGDEGFLIMFRAKDQGNWYWWNLGGWGNTRHNIEHSVDGGKALVAADVPGRIETGRWYDIRVELVGDRIRCYLDEKLVHDVHYSVSEPPLGVVATREDKSGDILLKVVNITSSPRETQVDIQGVKQVEERGTVTTLTSTNPTDENSFEAPRKISPVYRRVDNLGGHFTYTFPAYSVSIVRLKTR